MSTFLAASFHPRVSSEREAAQRFDEAVSLGKRLKQQAVTTRLGAGALQAAVFERLSGELPPPAVDPATGAWLAVCGSWITDGGLDTAALLSVFLARGPEAVANRLQGAFTVIAGVPQSRTLVVITDPVGTHHTFHVRTRDGVLVSSSSMLLATLDENGALDPVACQEFLRTGTIYEDRTLHAAVRRLAHGSIHEIIGGGVPRSRRWWDARSFCTATLHGAAAVDALGDALESAVKRIAGRQRVACDLTGGYDSRMVFAACLAAGVDMVPTVTGAPSMPDVVVAKEVAAAAGKQVLHVPPAVPGSVEAVHEAMRLADGSYDLVEYSQILAVHRFLARRHQLSLNGSAGEVARGKLWPFAWPRLWARSSAFVKKLVAARYRDDGATAGIFRADDRLDLPSHFEGVLGRELTGWDDMPAYARADAVYLLRMRCWQGRIASSTDQIWPVFSPFLARSVVETSLAMDPASRIAGRAFRRYLWQRHRTLAKVPMNHGFPPAPFRPDTAHLFTGLLQQYWTRAERKLRRLPWGDGLPHRAARLLLLERPGVSALLDPTAMQSAPLFEPAALETFLARAQEQRFSFDPQWRRLLSLELLLRTVASARSRRAREREDGASPPVA